MCFSALGADGRCYGSGGEAREIGIQLTHSLSFMSPCLVLGLYLNMYDLPALNHLPENLRHTLGLPHDCAVADTLLRYHQRNPLYSSIYVTLAHPDTHPECLPLAQICPLHLSSIPPTTPREQTLHVKAYPCKISDHLANCKLEIEHKLTK